MERNFTISAMLTKRQSTKGSTKQKADDCKRMFDMCDKYNNQIKNVCGLSSRVARSIYENRESFIRLLYAVFCKIP